MARDDCDEVAIRNRLGRSEGVQRCTIAPRSGGCPRQAGKAFVHLEARMADGMVIKLKNADG
jgi:hypothetical protein